MTAPQCRGKTEDGTRCRNHGHCPHHSGAGTARRGQRANKGKPSRATTAASQAWEQQAAQAAARESRLDPLVRLEPWPAYNPAVKSKVKDTTRKPKIQPYIPRESYIHKSPRDMTNAEFNQWRSELARDSTELTKAWRKSPLEFFRVWRMQARRQ